MMGHRLLFVLLILPLAAWASDDKGDVGILGRLQESKSHELLNAFGSLSSFPDSPMPLFDGGSSPQSLDETAMDVGAATLEGGGSHGSKAGREPAPAGGVAGNLEAAQRALDRLGDVAKEEDARTTRAESSIAPLDSRESENEFERRIALERDLQGEAAVQHEREVSRNEDKLRRFEKQRVKQERADARKEEERHEERVEALKNHVRHVKENEQDHQKFLRREMKEDVEAEREDALQQEKKERRVRKEAAEEQEQERKGEVKAARRVEKKFHAQRVEAMAKEKEEEKEEHVVSSLVPTLEQNDVPSGEGEATNPEEEKQISKVEKVDRKEARAREKLKEEDKEEEEEEHMREKELLQQQRTVKREEEEEEENDEVRSAEFVRRAETRAEERILRKKKAMKEREQVTRKEHLEHSEREEARMRKEQAAMRLIEKKRSEKIKKHDERQEQETESSRREWEAAERKKQALLRKTFLDQAVQARMKMKELEADATRRREERKEEEEKKEEQHEKRVILARMERRKQEAMKRLEGMQVNAPASSPLPVADLQGRARRKAKEQVVQEKLLREDDKDRMKERQLRVQDEERAHAQHSKIKKFEEEAVRVALARDRKWKAREELHQKMLRRAAEIERSQHEEAKSHAHWVQAVRSLALKHVKRQLEEDVENLQHLEDKEAPEAARTEAAKSLWGKMLQTRKQLHAQEEEEYRRARRSVLVSKQALRKAREGLELDKEKEENGEVPLKEGEKKVKEQEEAMRILSGILREREAKQREEQAKLFAQA